MRRGSLLPLVVLSLLLGGAECGRWEWRVAALGDSHSDPERDPRYDWAPWLPGHWVVADFSTSGQACWEIVPLALAEAETLAASRTLVIFCGTNDAGRTDWDLEISAGWIETAIQWAIDTRKSVVLVTPPPAFRNYPVYAYVRNQRLEALRARIFELAEQYQLDVADLYAVINDQPDPASLFEDGLHFSPEGRGIISQTIELAVYQARYQVGIYR